MPISLDTGLEMELLAELRLGLPPLFYCRLVETQDDWGFVLKVHSFFEGTLTMVIQHKLQLQKGMCESLTPRDSFVSRVHLANRLNILEPDFKAFLLGLNQLRNEITHNVRYLDFSLRSYVDGLSDAEFRRTAFSLCVGFKNVPLAEAPASISALRRPASSRHLRTMREWFWDLHPRFSIWNAGVPTLDLLSLQLHFEREGATFRAETGLEANPTWRIGGRKPLFSVH